MAPLPETNTARLKVKYGNAVGAHSAIIRLTDESAVSDAESAFEAFTTALGGSVVDSTVTGVELASSGSDLFFPVAGASLVGYNWGGVTANLTSNSQFYQVSGRSVGGRRAKFYLFGWNSGSSNYRLTGSEDASVTTAVAALNAETTSFVAIDGLTTVWYVYLNIKANDHWVHQARIA